MKPTFRRLLFAACLTTIAFAQTAKLQPAAASSTDGRYLVAEELPAPQWEERFGGFAATLRLHADGAAAYRASFASLHLPAGSQMFLYGLDAEGKVTAIHGPYEGNGPLNVPEFTSEMIAGETLAIEVRGQRLEQWPFQLDAIERISSLDTADIHAVYEPRKQAARDANIIVQSGYFRGRLVSYKVIDGMAVMEGDMVLGPAEEMAVGSLDRKSNGRRDSLIVTGSTNTEFRWPLGVIPYTINFAAGSTMDTRVKEAIAYWNQQFPGTLVPRSSQADFVTFRPMADVCQSRIGRVTGQQFIDLDSSCSRGNIIHEIGHALGLLHEHTRFDRDQFVTINWSRIQSGKSGNFVIPDAEDADDAGAYDYGSIMHYPTTAFSINGLATITITGVVPPGVVVGQRTALSNGDRAGVRAMYCNAALWVMPSNMLVDFGTQSFNIKAPAYCTWTVSDTTSWITLSTINGSGSGTVNFSVSPNPLQVYRNGSIKINGRSVAIKQEPL